MRGLRPFVAVALFALADCADPPEVRSPTRDHVETLWDLAPPTACSGVVVQDGAFVKAFELLSEFGDGPARGQVSEAEKRQDYPALDSPDAWRKAGLDPSLGAAAFTWPEKERGALLVLPVRDRVAFRAAFHATVATVEGRAVDTLPTGGYLCAEVSRRYVCAKSMDDIAEAVARHSPPLTYAVAHLPPDDHGDLEFYSDAHAPAVAKLVTTLAPLGTVTAVAGGMHVRADGVSGRLHVVGEMATPLAKSLAGGLPLAGFAAAAGAPTYVRVHADPTTFPPSDTMTPETRAEFLEQWAGDFEMATSGGGLAALWAAATLKDAARVEAYVKKTCADAGTRKRKYALDRIQVEPHGCSAVFDPKVLLLPIVMTPVKLVATVVDNRLVMTVGDGAEPTAALRTDAGVANDSGASWALTDAEALVAFTKSPWIGPPDDAGKAFKGIIGLLDDKTVHRIDAFNEVATHVAQAMIAARITEGGIAIDADVVTFARDPKPAYEAYRAALQLRQSGDVAGYRARLADIEKQFPGTLAAQRAADVRSSGPYLGAGTMLLGWMNESAKKAR